MKIRRFMFLVMFAFPALHYAQHRGWNLEIASGGEGGWWIHRLGTTTPLQPYNLGWTRTHLSIYLPADIVVQHTGERVTFGAGAGKGWLLDTAMLGTSHAQSHPEYIYVGRGAVRYTQFFAQMEYCLSASASGRYRFSPSLRVGSYLINTTHPDKDRFGFRYLVEAGVTSEFALRKLSLFFRPQYMVMTLYPDPRITGEIHKTYSFGVDAGLRLYLKP